MDITKIKQSVDAYRLQLQCGRCGGSPDFVKVSHIAEVDDRVFCGIMMSCGCRNMGGLTNSKGDRWVILADFACQGGDLHINEVSNLTSRQEPVYHPGIEIEANNIATYFEREFQNGKN